MARARASLIAVILAAGQGTRMRSKKAKLLHPVAGRPMLALLLDAVEALRPQNVVTVTGYQSDLLRASVEQGRCAFVLQREQRGTAHAVLQAAARITASRCKTLLVLNGDVPTIRAATLRSLIGAHQRSGAALTLLTTEVDDPGGYGRIVRDDSARVERIVEHRDASAAQRRLREINCGIYCARPQALLQELKRLRPNNTQGEYYLTDAVHQLIQRGERVHAVRHSDADEVLGVNTRAELARATRTLFLRKAHELQAAGVTVMDEARSWIDPRARIGRDSVIYPDVSIEGPSVLGEDCVVRAGSRISNSSLGKGVEVRDHSVLQDARVGDRTQLGPFAHLRPGSDVGPDCRIGNFVELKQAKLGRGSKASHLSYLGDAVIGADCNIGAGTITCNYDGETKHQTTLGRGVFIGSDSQLVAPVTVRAGAYVAAGSTVTKDVPAGALAIGRGRQRNIDGWVGRRRKK